MNGFLTASMLYNLVQCPHRLALDLYGDFTKRDPVNKFVQLLWERGIDFEKEVIQELKIPFTDLSGFTSEEREHLTAEAIERGDDLIYAGRIHADDLLGDPDLLRRQENGYITGDIKSGAGEEGVSDLSEGKPKKHYAVQLALYTDILERQGNSAGRFPFVWDIHREEVVYNLNTPQGVRTPQSLWDYYEKCLITARRIIRQHESTLPALASKCKLCHWRTVCIYQLEQLDDLSLIPELGRSRRNAMLNHVKTVSELAQIDVSPLIRGKKTVIARISPDTLRKFQARARLQIIPNASPYLRQPVDLPQESVELFFDIEVDPMRDICYLHGFVERRDNDTSQERYISFFAVSPTENEEQRAFAEAWAYVKASQPNIVYYYSKYERTWWRKLQQRYSSVVTEEEIEAMFEPARAIDLYYDVIRRHSEWPTRDHSLKTLASFLGFKWRDTSPSGAESVEWYHRWVESGDDAIKQRILEYNEDDCKAMRVLLDGIRGLEIKPAQ